MRAYGEYYFREEMILVTLEPVAAIRFKRVFERVEKAAAAWIALTATPENVRELEWFMARFPLMPRRPADFQRLYTTARDYDRTQAAVLEIMAPDYVPPAVPLALPAREYQLVPAALLKTSGGVLVADEVGLGKTVESIVALVEPGALPALIVTLTHLPRQFEREIKRFAPQLTTHVIRHGSPAPAARPSALWDLAAMRKRGMRMPDVVITSYSKLAGWAEWLMRYHRPTTVIWDEVQEFRHGFETSKTVKNIRNRSGLFIAVGAKRRMGLSATPIHNRGAEIWPVMEVILPGALGTKEEFLREWCKGGGLVEEPALLGTYLRERGLVIRRTKAEVGRELPPLTISEQFCDADPKVLDEMNRSTRAVELAQFVLSGKREAFQASGEFDMFVRQQTGIAKAPFVAAFVNMLLESGEPVVLYGWHHAVYDLWRDLLKDHEPAFFTGKESEKQKNDAVERFRTGETKLFIISLRSGAGLDGLQYAGCSNVVFGELDWSPAIHEQAIGRVRRDGILVPVTAWFLVSEVGSDPTMSEKLGVKRGQLEGLRDPQGGVVAGQTDADAIKRLARAFLKSRGVAMRPEATT